MTQQRIAIAFLPILAAGATHAQRKRKADPSVPQTQKLPDQIVTVDEGRFLFTGLTIGPCMRDGIVTSTVSIYLQGTVVNRTNRTWSDLRFSVPGTYEGGYRESIASLHVRNLAPNKGAPLDTLEPECGALLFNMENNRLLKSWEIALESGRYEAKYTLAMVKPKPSDNLAFEDDALMILFAAEPKDMAFGIKNKTDHAVHVDWNQAALVDPQGKSH